MTNTGAVTKYYHALGRAVAVRQSGTLSYLLADRLGSTLETLDGSGNTLNEMRYWPYGGRRAGTMSQTDKLYTGQQQEPDTAQPEIAGSSIGLYNYKARFYSTVTGRFVSADPIGGNAGDPPSWDPYSYVRANPLRLVDRTGMAPTDDDKERCATVLVDCLWFSAGGDAERYIQLVADFFNLPADVLSAIVLNEYTSISFNDIFDGDDLTIPGAVPIFGGKTVGGQIGIAQIDIDLAMEVQRYGRGFEKLYVDRAITKARLNEPRWAVALAAAVLDYRANTTPGFRRFVDSDLIVIYYSGPSNYRKWRAAGGCDSCGDTSIGQIRKVKALYPTAIKDLARIVSNLLPR